MADVVSETTNCNSCHPGHCGRFRRAFVRDGRRALQLQGAACTRCSGSQDTQLEGTRIGSRMRDGLDWHALHDTESPSPPVAGEKEFFFYLHDLAVSRSVAWCVPKPARPVGLPNHERSSAPSCGKRG